MLRFWSTTQIRIRKAFVRPRALIVFVYGTVIALGVFFFLVAKSNTHISFPMFGFNLNLSSDFIGSFVASWWQDVIFFAILGLPVILLTSINPTEHNIHARVDWLFAGKRKTPEVQAYLSNLILENSAFSSFSEIDVCLEEFDERLNAFRISVVFVSELSNLLKNEPYKGPVEFAVYPDRVASADGVLGQINSFSIHDATTNSTTDLMDGNAPIIIRDPENPISRCKEITIDPDGQIRYEYSYWQWADKNVSFRLGVRRFTQQLNLNLRYSNQLATIRKTKVEADIRHPQAYGIWRKSKQKVVLRNCKETQVLKYKSLEFGQGIEIKFSNPIQY